MERSSRQARTERKWGWRHLLLATSLLATPALADPLLFHATLDRDFAAETAAGDPIPNFRSGVTIVPDGARGGAAKWADDGYVAWNAPGNIRAARGTLAFFWRPREPLGTTPFVLFRVGFADHSSWDMAFLRIDWNGHGFDAFVTDANLSRVRVSWTIPQTPAPTAWSHIAFAWDETVGVRLFVDGKEVARKDQTADLDAGLDQFGLAGRVMSPHQVQSRYNFMRGSDVDDIRVYDAMLPEAEVARLSASVRPEHSRGTLEAPARQVPRPRSARTDRRGVQGDAAAARRTAWLHRFGWDTASPPALAAPVTRVRKVEFADAKDMKQWMWKGIDGIAETTWPGVYNRSRLPGRSDYFDLPDWNVYVEGGKRYDLVVPADERFNRVEIRGAAFGSLDWSDDGKPVTLARRPKGVVRSVTSFTGRQGGRLSFTNTMQEQPIQELWAYDIGPGTAPAGSLTLSYTVDAAAAPTLAALDPANDYIAGRFPPEERATVVALPSSGVKAAVGAGNAGATAAAARVAGAAPIVHILVPSTFADAHADRPIARAFDYGWRNLHDGLDGIAIDLPAMKATPGRDGLIPLSIRVRDPLWPGRDMIDLSVSVRPNEARTLWLDLRDRILPDAPLFLTIASAAPDFGPDALNGAKLRLIFKDRAAALPEHVADRLNQVKDNWAFLVEEHTASRRAGLYRRLDADITDLLRVDPGNAEARAYWSDIGYQPAAMPPFVQPVPPAGVPLWAFRQLEDLKLVRQFVDWWIDQRQVPYGDFGGGISDDTDLTQQWPGLALMGVQPDRINASLKALSEAVYRNGMKTGGLATLTTDELHAYEEGLNSDAERLYLNWGEPRSVERLMQTTRDLAGKIILRNPAGHLHFASSWYGGTTIHRDPPWAWQKPYAFVVMHAPMLVGLYNANPAARSLVTGLTDGLQAHGKQGADGLWTYPNEVNWDTDAERAGDGGGANTPLQSAWASWRFTGDDRYLRPLRTRLARSPAALAEMNENGFDILPEGPAARAKLLAQAAGGDPFARYAAWAATGDVAWLEALHADAIADKSQRMEMMTTGHWWSDRVEQPSDILQRERLGGIALKRGQAWPGHTVSWAFADPADAERVAILLPNATPTRFRVIAWNTTATPVRAAMTTWNVIAGRWTMRRATGETETLNLERSASADLVLPPGETVLDFALATPGDPVEQRPDLGIGPDDVVRKGGSVSVTVHSLGARDTGGGMLTVTDAAGAVLARKAIPPLAAPLDLNPRTTTLRLTVPRRPGLTVRVALPGNAAEVTRLNNMVALP